MGRDDLVLRSRRVVLPQAVQPATIHIAGGRIAAVGDFDALHGDQQFVDAGDLVVMPGVVDVHVHINEPGRTHWEGFRTATRAAAAGGVTTLIEMPLNSIPATTTVDAFHQKLAAAEGKCWVDVGFWGGVVPGNAAQLRPLFDAGVWGFKCFLVPSGVDEFPHVSESDLCEAMPILSELGATLLVHAEVPGPIDAVQAGAWGDDSRASRAQYASYLASRPRAAENEAIALMIRLAQAFSTPVHIVHLVSSDALHPLREARTAGLPVTVETCPHYLVFAAEHIDDGATEHKCAPPIREAANRDALWQALADRDIDFLASDHSPCPPQMKCLETGDFRAAWGGVASLQHILSAVWTEASGRGHGLDDMARWMCHRPARFAGLDRRKGSIAPGMDADLVIWDPDAEQVVERATMRQRHAISPYVGRRLRGRVEATYLRGREVFRQGELGATPHGRCLRRKDP